MNWYETLRESPMFTNPNRVDDLGLLYPPFRDKVLLLLKDARIEGLKPVVFETFRSEARQHDLYTKGRTRIKTIGCHGVGLAMDVVLADGKGNPTWPPVSDPRWAHLANISRRYGLYPGFDWKNFRDCPHHQFTAASKDKETIENALKGIYPA